MLSLDPPDVLIDAERSLPARRANEAECISYTRSTDLNAARSGNLHRFKLAQHPVGRESFRSLEERHIFIGQRSIAQAVVLMRGVRESNLKTVATVEDAKMVGTVENFLGCLFRCVRSKRTHRRENIPKRIQSATEQGTRNITQSQDVIFASGSREYAHSTPVTQSRKLHDGTPVHSPPTLDRDMRLLGLKPKAAVRPVPLVAASPAPRLERTTSSSTTSPVADSAAQAAPNTFVPDAAGNGHLQNTTFLPSLDFCLTSPNNETSSWSTPPVKERALLPAASLTVPSPKTRYAKELASPLSRIFAHNQREQNRAIFQGVCETKRIMAQAAAFGGAGDCGADLGGDQQWASCSTHVAGKTDMRSSRRRHSADAFHLRFSYDRHVNRTRRSMHHRKSECEETLAQAALQARQFAEIKSAQASSTSDTVYCGSSQSVQGQATSSNTRALHSVTTFDLQDCQEIHPFHHFMHHNCPVAHATAALLRTTDSEFNPQNISAKVAEIGIGTNFLSSIMSNSSSSACGLPAAAEIWPASITSHLTSNQPLLDRFQLLWLLEEVLKNAQQQRVSKLQNLTSPTHRNPIAKKNSVILQDPPPVRFISNAEKQLLEVGGTSDFSKIKPKRTNRLKLLSGVWCIPRPDKVDGGEDAVFLNDEIGFLGVADGVGEWGEMGCNPRKFAEELMCGAAAEAAQVVEKEKLYGDWPPKEPPSKRGSVSSRCLLCLQAGFNNAHSIGSATALVAGLDGSGSVLGVSNLGDSALVVLRRESRQHRQFTTALRTKEQQHFFNCPYQLSAVPSPEDLPALEKQGLTALVDAIRNMSTSYKPDTPDMADVYEQALEEGDLIVACTDGVFDNLFDHEVSPLVSLALSPYEAKVLEKIGLNELMGQIGLGHCGGLTPPERDPKVGYATPPRDVARALAEAAFYRSVDNRAKTPFCRAARRAGNLMSFGGKMDDITVIASWVVADESDPEDD